MTAACEGKTIDVENESCSVTRVECQNSVLGARWCAVDLPMAKPIEY